jgi:hypothetical protein
MFRAQDPNEDGRGQEPSQDPAEGSGAGGEDRITDLTPPGKQIDTSKFPHRQLLELEGLAFYLSSRASEEELVLSDTPNTMLSLLSELVEGLDAPRDPQDTGDLKSEAALESAVVISDRLPHLLGAVTERLGWFSSSAEAGFQLATKVVQRLFLFGPNDRLAGPEVDRLLGVWAQTVPDLLKQQGKDSILTAAGSVDRFMSTVINLCISAGRDPGDFAALFKVGCGRLTSIVNNIVFPLERRMWAADALVLDIPNVDQNSPGNAAEALFSEQIRHNQSTLSKVLEADKLTQLKLREVAARKLSACAELGPDVVADLTLALFKQDFDNPTLIYKVLRAHPVAALQAAYQIFGKYNDPPEFSCYRLREICQEVTLGSQPRPIETDKASELSTIRNLMADAVKNAVERTNSALYDITRDDLFSLLDQEILVVEAFLAAYPSVDGHRLSHTAENSLIEISRARLSQLDPNQANNKDMMCSYCAVYARLLGTIGVSVSPYVENSGPQMRSFFKATLNAKSELDRRGWLAWGWNLHFSEPEFGPQARSDLQEILKVQGSIDGGAALKLLPNLLVFLAADLPSSSGTMKFRWEFAAAQANLCLSALGWQRQDDSDSSSRKVPPDSGGAYDDSDLIDSVTLETLANALLELQNLQNLKEMSAEPPILASFTDLLKNPRVLDSLLSKLHRGPTAPPAITLLTLLIDHPSVARQHRENLFYIDQRVVEWIDRNKPTGSHGAKLEGFVRFLERRIRDSSSGEG